MAADGPIYRVDFTRTDLQLLVEAIMCATTSEKPGLAEEDRMRELGLSLQRVLDRDADGNAPAGRPRAEAR